jgi:hypothetical protein
MPGNVSLNKKKSNRLTILKKTQNFKCTEKIIHMFMFTHTSNLIHTVRKWSSIKPKQTRLKDR